jgi:hypothetical protein
MNPKNTFFQTNNILPEEYFSEFFYWEEAKKTKATANGITICYF